MKVLITGGAGFIGCNSAKKFMDRGDKVIVLDNLSRKGTDINLKWLKTQGVFSFYKADIRNYNEILEIFKKHKDIDLVLHLAAQVAVTTSVADPRSDFEINALGTFNLLEAIRELGIKPVFIYASTNKVYGGMTDIEVIQDGSRYRYKDLSTGIPEDRLLDFHSPYGCSKGAADQYVIDYARIYGIPTVSLRQSCIYGPQQLGVEDQGWVAWFTIAGILDRPITIYGDGKQVRDVLYIDDLVDCYIGTMENIDKTKGRAYNIGGGPNFTMSLLELIDLLGKSLGKKIKYTFSDWRPGDQPIFICDIRKAKNEFGWEPKIEPQRGVTTLIEWVKQNKEWLAGMF